MLSVKVVQKDGKEEVFEATSVRRTEDGRIAFGRETIIETGRVYIMNDAGHTIAVYNAEKKEQSNEQ